MNQTSVGADVEGAPRTAVQEPVKASRWRRKRVWVSLVVIVFLVLFGVIFGAVYGTKKAQKDESEQREKNRLFAAQGDRSSSPSSYLLSSSTRVNYAATITPFAEDPTSLPESPTSRVENSSPSPSPSPTSSSGPDQPSDDSPESEPAESATYSPPPAPQPSPGGPILQPIGTVPREISAAVGAPSLLFWDLRAGGRLWELEEGGAWAAYGNRQFLVAPLAVRTGESTQTAITLDAFSGRIVYRHFHSGAWEDWQELEFGAQFLRRPAAVSRAEGRLDVVGVDNNGYVWLVSFDGSEWSEWTELGSGFESDMSVVSWDENRLDVFGTKRTAVWHKHWMADSGWADDWDNLGDPFFVYSSSGDSPPSAPLVVSWRDGEGDGVIDVVVNAGSSVHKLFKNGAWSEWTIIWASHEGYEFPDTQSILKGDALDGRPFAHLISRGTDNCIHYNKFNGTHWDFWDYTWCSTDWSIDDYYPTQFLPTFIADGGGGVLELLGRDVPGNLLRLQVHGTVPDEWSNDNWENLGKPEG